MKLMLNVLIVETLETRILPLPRNPDILQIFPGRFTPLWIAKSNGKAMGAVAFITIVNENDVELV